MARLQNNQGDSDQAPKSTPRNFRHSTKVGTRRPNFTLSTSGGITFNDENNTTVAFEPTPTASDETILTTTPRAFTAATATESSILSDFFSTQVLNTRAVDPDLDLSAFDLSRNITIRSLSSTSTTPTTTSVKPTTTTAAKTTTTSTTSTTTKTSTTTEPATSTTTAAPEAETTTTTTTS